MVKKKRQRFVRIVKKSNKKNGWAFKSWIGVVVATFLVSFCFISANINGNVISNSFGRSSLGLIGIVLFVAGLVELTVLLKLRFDE